MQVLRMDQVQLTEKCMTVIKFELESGAQSPHKAHPDDAGWDVYARDDGELVYDSAGELMFIRYDTGVKCDPGGAFLLLFPRSSVCKTDLIMANSVGLIDPGYRGNIIAVFRVAGETKMPDQIKRYKKGDRVAQLVPMIPVLAEFQENSLSASGRGTGGFGSTGS